MTSNGKDFLRNLIIIPGINKPAQASIICRKAISLPPGFIYSLAVLFIVFALTGCRTATPLPSPTVRPVHLWRTARATPSEPVRTPTPAPRHRSGVSSLAYIGPVSIVIDPGHGGRDPGARGFSRVPEKTIVLNVALELVSLLRESGANIIMTRQDDRFIELNERAAIAERNHADLFVSIHADAFRRATADGATVLIGRTASRRSKKAARYIKAALEHAGIYCRPIRPQQLRVCEAHSRPAVLVECGFLTNRLDAQNLNTPQYQFKIALAIANGITDFFIR